MSGTNGIRERRSSGVGRNGPANSRRMPDAASPLKISPGRRRRPRRWRGPPRTRRGPTRPRPCAASRTTRRSPRGVRLVDRHVLGPRRVGADRRGVDEPRHLRNGRGLEHPAAALDVDRSGLLLVARGLDQPGEVDDSVGALQQGHQGCAGDVGALPIRPSRGRMGTRRAIPSTDPTSGSSTRALTTLVPTLPVAPVTTMRTLTVYPNSGKTPPLPESRKRARARFCGTPKAVL